MSPEILRFLADAVFAFHGFFVLVVIPSTLLLLFGYYRSLPLLFFLHWTAVVIMVAGTAQYGRCPLVELEEADRQAVYYAALLVNVGCHTDAHEQARWFGDDLVLCVNNLSRFAQPVELSLQRCDDGGREIDALELAGAVKATGAHGVDLHHAFTDDVDAGRLLVREREPHGIPLALGQVFAFQLPRRPQLLRAASQPGLGKLPAMVV